MADPVEFELLSTLRGIPEQRRGELQALYASQRKDRGVAILLHCIMFLGFPGIGRLYVGDVGIGICQFLFTYFSCGILALWPLVDLFFIMGAADNHNRLLLRRLALSMG
ncbi:MAG: NINE protein [Fimbriimonadaceae bacterium]